MGVMVVTTSQLKTFKSCRRKYMIEYRECLKPEQQSDALITGSSYHDKVEQFLKTGEYAETGDVTDAMIYAYVKHIYPQYGCGGVKSAEQSFDKSVSRGIHLAGKIDAIAEDGRLIEHKTTSESNLDAYEYRVHFQDTQVSNYLIAMNKNVEIIYDVIRKPTIRLKKNETMEEYIERCKQWYDDDPDSKLRVFTVYRTDDELQQAKKEIIMLAKEIKRCDKQSELYYRNTASCSLYGSCPFASICGESSFDYVAGFIHKKAVNEELGGGIL